MKKRFMIFSAIIFALVVSVCAFISAGAQTGNDPLISLSYLNNIVIPQLKEQILTEVDELVTAKTANLPAQAPSYTGESIPLQSTPTDSANTDTAPVNVSYTLLELTYGQTVLAEGICEFIPRPGSYVTAVSPFPTQGIADITNGNEILDGQEVPANAYCLIPRGGDGRGFRVQSQIAYIMIRGEYTIG